MPINPGSTWLLLRGLTREKAHWGTFKTQLEKAYPESRVEALDLPGMGIFYKDKSPNTIPEITAKVREHAQQQGLLDAQVNLLAVSLGGMVALDWMQTNPAEINCGVLINVSLAQINPFYNRLRWQCYPQLLRTILQTDLYQRELAIIKLISNRAERYAELADVWQHIQRNHPVSLKNTLAQLIAAARYCPNNQKPQMPVLLLNSLGDRLVSPHCSAAISRLWNVPCITHHSAGHDLTTDDGDWVLEQVKNFTN
jgi:pimeloyl-[acyl-carrier protein] methyl ester esterase